MHAEACAATLLLGFSAPGKIRVGGDQIPAVVHFLEVPAGTSQLGFELMMQRRYFKGHGLGKMDHVGHHLEPGFVQHPIEMGAVELGDGSSQGLQEVLRVDSYHPFSPFGVREVHSMESLELTQECTYFGNIHVRCPRFLVVLILRLAQWVIIIIT